MGLLLYIPNEVPDVNLFQEELAGRGEAQGEVRPLQASVLGVAVVCPPPHLHCPPHQLQAYSSLGTYGHLAGPLSGIAQLGVGWPLGQTQVAREMQEHQRPARRWPRAWKGKAGQ